MAAIEVTVIFPARAAGRRGRAGLSPSLTFALHMPLTYQCYANDLFGLKSRLDRRKLHLF
jgi:hypothetical protein